ncbi:hypothetical protein A0256_22295 [Mucilaginibacter sp. PAMC 26640]|nr:hypothetical protein A0256_22295 [Mucilaginibacter sp. PAMC 26640]
MARLADLNSAAAPSVLLVLKPAIISLLLIQHIQAVATSRCESYSVHSAQICSVYSKPVQIATNLFKLPNFPKLKIGAKLDTI